LKETKLPATPSNLIRLVREYATPETLSMVANEWDDCPEVQRLELVAEAWATYEQGFMIVVINKSNTYGLINNTLDDTGDNAEYLSLWDNGSIKHWFE